MSKTITEKISAATIRSLVKESDRGCIILLSSMLEEKLERLHLSHVSINYTGEDKVEEFFKKTLLGAFGPLVSFSGKINMAYAYGLITHDEFCALNIVRKLRNEAAHCGFEFNLQDSGVQRLIAKMNVLEPSKHAKGMMIQFPKVSEVKRNIIVNCYSLRLFLSYSIAKKMDAVLNKK